MPVYEVQDAQGRTMTLEGDHEPTPDELGPLFTQAFDRVPSEAITSAVRQEPPRQIAPIDIPDFGKEGSVMRGVSQAVTGMGEFILNKPEEAVAAAFPPTAAAVALRYVPEILKQTGKDIYSAVTTGDKEAAGRAIGTAALLAAPVGVKKALDVTKAVAPASAEAAKATVDLVTEPKPPVIEPVMEAVKPAEPAVEPAKPVEAAPAPINEGQPGVRTESEVTSKSNNEKSITLTPNTTKSDIVRGIQTGTTIEGYHGTKSVFSDFDINKSQSIGIHFGTKEQAEKVASGGRVIKVSIRLKNPLVLDRDLIFNDPETLVKGLLKQKVFGESDKATLKKSLERVEKEQNNAAFDDEPRLIEARKAALRDIQSILESKGYDGIVYPNQIERNLGESPSFSVAVFNPNQIKQTKPPLPEAGATPESPAPAAEAPPIGITPSSRLSEFIDLMMPRESTTPPPIELKPGERLPVPRPFDEAKQIFVQPFGMGKLPVLGVVMDANARVRTPVQESVNAYYANNFGVRPAVSSAFGKEIQGTIDPFFDIDPATSVIKNIKPAREGLSLHVSDVLENLQRDPEAYVLTPEQRTAFERIQQHMAEIDKLEQEAGVKKLLTDDEAVASEQLSFDFLDDQRDPAYFPRIVTKRPKEPPVVPARQGGMGAKQFFQKTRIFNSEAEGVAAGYRYEPSIEKRLTTRVDRTYKAIFDKQFAEDPALGARSVKEVRAEVIRDMEDRVATGERTTPFTEEQLDAVVQGKVREGAVHQPGMAGKVFDPEVAAVLNKSLPRSSSELGQRFQSFNNVARELTLAGDLSSLFIQLLPSAYRNPVVWSRAAYNSIKALGDPRVHDRFMKDHIESVRELAQLGSSVGRREELLAGGGEKSLVERIPGVRRLYRPFLRQFETSLDTAKVLLWEAWRDVAKPEERLELARTLESQLGIGRVESAAIKHNQAFVERASLLASSMYRGFLNYLAAVGQRGISGKVARQGMGAFMAGAAATYVGVGLALGMSMDDVKERFNPARGDFMMWPVKVGGRMVNIGFGGFYKSLMRLAGNVYKTSIEHPGNWLSLAPDKNPFTRWWRSHASLPVGLAWNQFTGQDFLGGDTDITEIMPSLAAPLSSRETRKYLADKMAGRKTDDTLGQVATESLASFIGLSAWPESKRNQLARTIEDDAVERFNKPYDQLTLGEQRQVAKAVQALPEFKTKQEPTKREREAAFQADIDRVIRVRQALPEPLLNQLDKLEVKVRGFDPAITLDGVKIPLSRKQSEAYEQFIKEEYARMIPKAMPAILKQAKPEVRQKIMDQTLTAARELARNRLAKLNRKE